MLQYGYKWVCRTTGGSSELLWNTAQSVQRDQFVLLLFIGEETQVAQLLDVKGLPQINEVSLLAWFQHT
jgi:hypothetical protein